MAWQTGGPGPGKVGVTARDQADSAEAARTSRKRHQRRAGLQRQHWTRSSRKFAQVAGEQQQTQSPGDKLAGSEQRQELRAASCGRPRRAPPQGWGRAASRGTDASSLPNLSSRSFSSCVRLS